MGNHPSLKITHAFPRSVNISDCHAWLDEGALTWLHSRIDQSVSLFHESRILLRSLIESRLLTGQAPFRLESLRGCPRLREPKQFFLGWFHARVSFGHARPKSNAK